MLTGPIDPTSDRAVYRQLADLIRDQIHTGTLTPGTRLPGENRLAQEHGIGRETVRQALALLRTEGLVSTCQGDATRVRARATRHLTPLRPGDRATTRMPTEPERRRTGLADGIPIIEIIRAGGAVETHPADEIILAATTDPPTREGHPR